MKILAVAVASAALITSASAFAETFTGPYVGMAVAYDSYEVKASDVFVAGDNFDGLSGNGIAGGAFFGYDVPLGANFFGGVELAAELSDASISYDDTVDSFSVKAKESYGVSGRLGTMLNDSTGLYARLGWMNTRFKASFNGASDSETEDAFTYGAGVETRVGGNATVRVEYNFRDYGNAGLGSGVSVKNGQVQAGVSYRF